MVTPAALSHLCFPVLFHSTCLGLQVKMFFTCCVIGVHEAKRKWKRKWEFNSDEFPTAPCASLGEDVDKVIITAFCSAASSFLLEGTEAVGAVEEMGWQMRVRCVRTTLEPGKPGEWESILKSHGTVNFSIGF